jgi:hydroxymethylbilane synthase
VRVERELLGAWGGGCHQRFGVTQIDAGALGSLLHARGVRPDGSALEELRWSGKPAGQPAGPLRPWDGGERARPRAIGTEPAAPEPQPGRAWFVSNDRALPESWLPAARSSRIWVPGASTWFKLAARGLWVEGCAEGLGFDALRSTLTEPVLCLPPLEQWTLLTHADAVAGWSPLHATATYRLESTDETAGLENATHVFWSSAKQYSLLRHRVAPGAHHACGPGRTAAELERQGVTPLSIFPSIREWQTWIGGSR